jgi:hypothetical protein
MRTTVGSLLGTVLLLRPSERDELLLLSSRDLKDLIPGEKRLIGRLQDESMTTCFWEPASQAMILRTASSFFRSSHKGAKRAPARRCQGVPLMRVAFRTRACGHGCRVISGRWTMSDSSCPVKPRISISDASWRFGTSVSRDAGIFFCKRLSSITGMGPACPRAVSCVYGLRRKRKGKTFLHCARTRNTPCAPGLRRANRQKAAGSRTLPEHPVTPELSE